jgi:hypothetical protein
MKYEQHMEQVAPNPDSKSRRGKEKTNHAVTRSDSKAAHQKEPDLDHGIRDQNPSRTCCLGQRSTAHLKMQEGNKEKLQSALALEQQNQANRDLAGESHEDFLRTEIIQDNTL